MERAGVTGVVALAGGPEGWAAAHGAALETGT
jgi:hypothetical protein